MGRVASGGDGRVRVVVAALAADVVELLAQDADDLRLERVLDVAEEDAAHVLHDGARAAVVLGDVAAGVERVEHARAAERTRAVLDGIGSAGAVATVAVERHRRGRRRRIAARVSVEHQRGRVKVGHQAVERRVVEVELEPPVRGGGEPDVQIRRGVLILRRQAGQEVVVLHARLDGGGAAAQARVFLDGANVHVACLEVHDEMRLQDVVGRI